MGPTEARDERIPPRPLIGGRAYGERAEQPVLVEDTACSWFEYDCARLIGRVKLSFWQVVMLAVITEARKTVLPEREDVEFVTHPAASLCRVLAHCAELRAHDT